MRLVLLSVALFAGVNAFAKVTFKTSLTCQVEDGDEWVEFGLRKEGERTQVVVVQHHDDDTAELVARRFVAQSRSPQGRTLWTDASRTLQIQLHNVRGKLTADFTLLKDGPGSISESGLLCYKNSQISFDGWPRK